MTLLHYLGDALRTALLMIPLGVVRVAFVLLPLLILIWVCRLPSTVTARPNAIRSWATDLKIWAVLALSAQVVIYLLI